MKWIHFDDSMIISHQLRSWQRDQEHNRGNKVFIGLIIVKELQEAHLRFSHWDHNFTIRICDSREAPCELLIGLTICKSQKSWDKGISETVGQVISLWRADMLDQIKIVGIIAIALLKSIKNHILIKVELTQTIKIFIPKQDFKKRKSVPSHGVLHLGKVWWTQNTVKLNSHKVDVDSDKLWIVKPIWDVVCKSRDQYLDKEIV